MNPQTGMNKYRMEFYNRGKRVKENSIEIKFLRDNIFDKINTIYSNAEEINVIVKKNGLKIYRIDGRKIDRITKTGKHYIIEENKDKTVNKKKLIIIK